MLPFVGLKVLDLSRVLAGPYCCSLLGELGADVVKVERPEIGDENRKWGKLWHGTSLDFMNVNRSKRAITVNINHTEGQEIIRRLARSSDVLVENFTSGTLEKYGLHYENLKNDNPRLVYCSLTAYGERGPFGAKPGYDGALQAFSGLMSITGEEDGPPVRCGASIVDMGTGLAAFGAILTALISRQMTGFGQKVSVSLLQTAIAFLGTHAAVYRTIGDLPTRAGAGVSHIAPYGAFKTSDSYVVTGALNESAWIKFCHALERSDLLMDVRFTKIGDRIANRLSLNAALNETFEKRRTKEWVERFESAGLVISPINTIADLMNHPQVDANEMMVHSENPNGNLELVGIPMRFSEWQAKPCLPSPELGQHTDDVLASIGYSHSDIAGLRSRGAV